MHPHYPHSPFIYLVAWLVILARVFHRQIQMCSSVLAQPAGIINEGQPTWKMYMRSLYYDHRSLSSQRRISAIVSVLPSNAEIRSCSNRN